VTPAARQLATSLGIDLRAVGRGPDGVIGLQQVQDADQTTPANKRGGIAHNEMRKAIAAAMAKSHREIPHYYVSSTLDVSSLMAWLEGENARRSVPDRLLYAVPIINAIAAALSDTPVLNGHYIDGQFHPAKSINLGIAVALRGGGLIAPAILDVCTLTLDETMARLSNLVARVRGGRLKSTELTESTVTFSNLGEDSADVIFPLIYPPQVAIIGCGKIAERPWVSEGKIAIRRTMTVTVAGDHRVSDGRAAAQFLTRLDRLLRSPQ
jgi:pyruvate dehydrogenase E2 component (dihydrolipoamide acetyltransferase)